VLAEILNLRKKQERRRRIFSNWPFSQSNFTLSLWSFLDSRLENKIRIKNKLLEAGTSKGKKGLSKQFGPFESISDTLSFFNSVVSYWKKSSLQMEGLSMLYDFSYFHFLQPNQYAPSSKPMSNEERAIAIVKGGNRATWAAEQGYPILIEEGNELQKSGLNFFDLTMMFENETRMVYKDDCCHFNELGNKLLAKRMAAEIKKVVK
jgi:hypothetical protein